jgi:hypothetical protein
MSCSEHHNLRVGFPSHVPHPKPPHRGDASGPEEGMWHCALSEAVLLPSFLLLLLALPVPLAHLQMPLALFLLLSLSTHWVDCNTVQASVNTVTNIPVTQCSHVLSSGTYVQFTLHTSFSTVIFGPIPIRAHEPLMSSYWLVYILMVFLIWLEDCWVWGPKMYFCTLFHLPYQLLRYSHSIFIQQMNSCCKNMHKRWPKCLNDQVSYVNNFFSIIKLEIRILLSLIWAELWTPSLVKILTERSQNVTEFGNTASQEVVKLQWGSL